MIINKTRNLVLAILTMCFTSGAVAQQVKEKPSVATKGTYKTILLPDFYVYERIKKGDTTFNFECYDRNDKQMDLDSEFNINNAAEIFIYKHYYQYPYKPGSLISPPYLAVRLYSFERTSKDTWLGTDLHTKVKTGVKEHMKDIARADTVMITDKVSGATEKIIHKYYKTAIVPAESIPGSQHIH